MKKIFFSLSAATVLAGGLCSCNGGQAVNLKMNLQPGTGYSTTVENKTVVEQTMGGNTMKTNQDITMEMSYNVAAGDGSNKKLTVTYDRLMLNAHNNMMSMQFDSKDPSKQDSMMRGINNIIGKPFTVTVTDKGDITKVEGVQEIINGMAAGTGPEAEVARRSVSGMFNDSSIRSMMQQSFNIYPDGAVHPGDTWKRSYNLSMGALGMSIDNTYKLTSVSGGTAHIDVTSVISHNGGAAQMQNMKMEMSGTQKGTLDVDVASGMVTEGKMQQHIKGTMTAGPMSVPITITSDVHLSGRKK